MRQIASLYLYDNELFAIEGNGKMVKDALENAARYFLSCRGESCSKGPLINTHIIGYNFDMAAGVDYEIDLTQPEGQRIRNLKGRPPTGSEIGPPQQLSCGRRRGRHVLECEDKGGAGDIRQLITTGASTLTSSDRWETGARAREALQTLALR